MSYQVAAEEEAIARSKAGAADPTFASQVVQLTRATRDHPEIRVGSSVRGAVDLLILAQQLSTLRGASATSRQVGLDAALTALSGRIQLFDSASVSPEEVITELYDKIMDPVPESESGDRDTGGSSETGKA